MAKFPAVPSPNCDRSAKESIASQKSSSLIPRNSFEGFKVFIWKLSIVSLYKGNAFVTLEFFVANFMCGVGCCTYTQGSNESHLAHPSKLAYFEKVDRS